MRLPVLLGIVALGSFAAACSEDRELDPDRLDAAVESAVVEGLGVTPTTIDCPAVTGISDGSTFTCEVDLDGQVLQMAGTVIEASEGTFEIDNLDAVLFVDVLELGIAAEISAELGEAIGVDCGLDGDLVVAEVGSRISCTAIDVVGNEAPLTVDVLDADGEIAYELG